MYYVSSFLHLIRIWGILYYMVVTQSIPLVWRPGFLFLIVMLTINFFHVFLHFLQKFVYSWSIQILFSAKKKTVRSLLGEISLQARPASVWEKENGQAIYGQKLSQKHLGTTWNWMQHVWNLHTWFHVFTKKDNLQILTQPTNPFAVSLGSEILPITIHCRPWK